jgi:hypothetical protein
LFWKLVVLLFVRLLGPDGMFMVRFLYNMMGGLHTLWVQMDINTFLAVTYTNGVSLRRMRLLVQYNYIIGLWLFQTIMVRSFAQVGVVITHLWQIAMGITQISHSFI